MDYQEKVREFHKKFNILVNEKPVLIEKVDRLLRLSLIVEELNELEDAMEKNSLIDIADALGDLLYVVFGTAVSYGINMDKVFKEIHRSNMTKVGGHKREDGKWIKPSTYSPPNLKKTLEE
jgi:predicted HAD superfamily Cof-like phosphohydrolase